MIYRWEYSRNQRRHTALGIGFEVYWIRLCRPYGEIKGKHGYRLTLPYSEFIIAESKSVATLKRQAEAREGKL